MSATPSPSTAARRSSTNRRPGIFKSAKDTSATITITNSAGQTAYTRQLSLKQGNSSFVWDGKGNDGVQWPAGTYTLTATGKDSSGNSVAISTEVQGIVDSVDLTASPPLLSIGGQNYTTDKIKRVVRPTAGQRSLCTPLAAFDQRTSGPAIPDCTQKASQGTRADSIFRSFSRRFVLKPWA